MSIGVQAIAELPMAAHANAKAPQGPPPRRTVVARCDLDERPDVR